MAAKPAFTVNEYDKDGDISETGIFLHFGETRIKVAETVLDMVEFIKHLKSIVEEITHNY